MSVLGELSRRLEEVTDAAAAAFDAEAEAENTYLAAYATAYAVAVEDKVPVSIRAKHADQESDVLAAHQELNRAVAARKRCVAKVEEVKNRLTAAQSHMRFIREAT